MAIAYNSTSSINSQTSSASSLTWSHTCNASDTKLVVCIGGRSTVSGVTYNGVSMTKVIETSLMFGYQYNSIWYLDSPTTGSAQNIVVTYSGANVNRMGVSVGISGCTTGVGTSANGNAVGPSTATGTITTTTGNSHVLAAGWINAVNASSITFGAGQTTIVNNTGTDDGFYLQYKTTTTAGSYSATIQQATTNLSMTVVEIKPSTVVATYSTLLMMGV